MYRVPYSCGEVYIGETRMWLETSIKEHMDAYRKGELEKSDITEHAWSHHLLILWDETLVIDRARIWRVFCL